ncbi:MAG: cation diffusion facilitator family transporter [Eubacteriales bacterium]|nr:cation diffusion facilitator family transporter [Eubacteriales bacterium]
MEKRFRELELRLGRSMALAQMGRRLSGLALIANVTLGLLKYGLGFVLASLALRADALNNFSDALVGLSSVIAFWIAKKLPDAKHPFGHARSEYAASLCISLAIFYLGIHLLIDSVVAFFHPSEAQPESFSKLALLFLAISIVVKLGLFFHYRRAQRILHSSLLSALMQDSVSDAFIDLILLGSFIAAAWIPAWLPTCLSLILALFILANALKLFRETMDHILGLRPDPELEAAMEASILSVDGVLAFHDFHYHEYGAGRALATVHIEVDADQSLMDAHEISDRVERKLAQLYGVQASCHLDPKRLDDRDEARALKETEQALREYDPNLKIHDFRLVFAERRNLVFDIEIDAKHCRNPEDLARALKLYLEERFPGNNVVITLECANVGLPIGEIL